MSGMYVFVSAFLSYLERCLSVVEHKTKDGKKLDFKKKSQMNVKNKKRLNNTFYKGMMVKDSLKHIEE